MIAAASRGVANFRRIRRGALWAAWGLSVMVGFGGLMVYGARGSVPGRPVGAAEAGISIAPEGFTLVMFVHPRCPCTDASMYDLEQLQTRCGASLHVRFLVYVPGGEPESWARGATWDHASRLSNGAVTLDPDAATARRLGAGVSGSVVLFDHEGKARFWGGITSGRGMAGESAGADAIAAIVGGTRGVTAPTKVYGCPLCGPSRACPGARETAVGK